MCKEFSLYHLSDVGLFIMELVSLVQHKDWNQRKRHNTQIVIFTFVFVSWFNKLVTTCLLISFKAVDQVYFLHSAKLTAVSNAMLGSSRPFSISQTQGWYTSVFSSHPKSTFPKLLFNYRFNKTEWWKLWTRWSAYLLQKIKVKQSVHDES